MNERKLPCVNTLLLNRYMKEQDFEAARDQALEAYQAEAIAEPITEDDVYEFACSLELASASNAREALAEKLRQCVASQGLQSQHEKMAALGWLVHCMVEENRHHRAEQRFWDEQ